MTPPVSRREEAGVDAAAAGQALRDQLPHVAGRSPLYARLLAGLAGAAERGFDGGVLPRLLALKGPDGDVRETRLLVLAALHLAALEDPSCPHAAWFPTAVGDTARLPTDGAPAALALAHLIEHEDEIAAFVRDQRVQTNEIGRCAALLPGFLAAAGAGLPLRLLEVGTAAGLNLRFDRYRYRYTGGPSWGPSGGPELRTRAEGEVPRALAPPTCEVAERRGVDLRPLDVEDPADVRLLHAFVWPDEADRHAHLDEAIAVARTTPAVIERGELVGWLAEHGHPRPGVATVLFHSQVRWLLDPATSTALADHVERMLRAATPDAPVTSLALEPPRGVPDDGSNWPELVVGIGDGSGPPRWRTLVSSDWHGRWVRWFPGV